MLATETRVVTRSVSARIIAAGIVIAFCYWASTVLVTILAAVLLAYFLDPLVSGLERLRIPRALGALLIVLLTGALLAGLGWSLIARFDQFGRDWPQYREPLRAAVGAVESRLNAFEMHISEITPPAPHTGRVLTISDSSPLRDALLGRLSSLYSFLFAITFIPFLVFFMLAAKRQVWHATMELFPIEKRTQAKDTLADVTHVLRSYLAGSALVALLLVLASWGFFYVIGIDFPFLVALISGLCNMVPYIGAVMSWMPPLLIGLKQFHSVGPFVGIFAMLTFFHIIAANLLVPALVGWRVRLNALALTVSLLFWGWLWGAMGLMLAIPITAVIKVICDHVESWQPVGRWLSA
ncbi:MAG: AI-2E family transporter [Acidobacteriota bacterium]|nr:AI-2E family transporter [Acidobacteriota bacterium]MDE3170430.1 AI-2E family transporter [Acidobacteriota bacterium]